MRRLLPLLALLCTVAAGPAERTVPVIVSLTAAPVYVPEAFARGAIGVGSCESGWNPAKVGAAGELGILQVHPVHGREMADMRLSFNDEADRWRFAVVLWRRAGWQPWACASEAGR